MADTNLPAGVPELTYADVPWVVDQYELEGLQEVYALGAQRAAEARSAEVEALRADKALLDAIDSHCWKLDPFETAEDDYGWRVSEYHMSEPRERAVAESFNGDLRAAISAAIAASKE